MIKLLGPFLALAAMTASIINAQCGVSCAIHSKTGGSNHSCCPPSAPPASTQPKDGDPCHHTEAAADGVRLKYSVSFTCVPFEIVVGRGHEHDPLFRKTHLDSPPLRDSSSLTQPSLASILRI